MKIIVDTHVHTIALEHAFFTVPENHAAAKKTGLSVLAVTDHTGKMTGAPIFKKAVLLWQIVRLKNY